MKWQLFYRPIGTIAFAFWKKPHIDDIYTSLDKLLKTRNSISRFGNGEFDVIWGGKIGFQHPDSRLGERLNEVLHSHLENHFVAISDFYHGYNHFRQHEKVYAYTWGLSNFYRIIKLLGCGGHYLNNYVSRPYSSYENVDMESYMHKLKQLWANEDLYVVAGDKTRVGVGNDLFSTATHVYRILAPSKSAFDKYDEILKAVQDNVPTGATIYLALGPTATVLAYDLTKLAYRALDMGHLDIELEYFLSGTTDKKQIKGKYVNEVDGGDEVDDSIVDEDYKKSIIATVL